MAGRLDWPFYEREVDAAQAAVDRFFIDDDLYGVPKDLDGEQRQGSRKRKREFILDLTE